MSNEPQRENSGFAYTYSAAQRQEVESIRSKYIPPQEDKLEQLRRLDAGVTRKGTAASLAVGVVSALLFGLGMCCCLVWGETMFLPGVVIGLAGLVGVALAYPIYARLTRKERERIAPEILRLTDELMQ